MVLDSAFLIVLSLDLLPMKFKNPEFQEIQEIREFLEFRNPNRRFKSNSSLAVSDLRVKVRVGFADVSHEFLRALPFHSLVHAKTELVELRGVIGVFAD